MHKPDLVASDVYWDGSNHERCGRNKFLYKGKQGHYFLVYLTQWMGERDRIEAISKEEALTIYEELPELELTYEETFGMVPKEA